MANEGDTYRTEAGFEAVLRQMPSGVVIAEAPSGKVLLSNESARQIRRCELPQSDVIEQYGEYDEFEGFHPDGRPYEPGEWPLARSIRTGEVVVDEEIDVVRGDGSCGVLVVSSSPVYDERGCVVLAVTVFYDVTERRRAEEEVRKLNENLERRVRERTARLEEKDEILDAALKNLTEGVLLVNTRGRALFANPAARRMLSIEGAELPAELADLREGLEHWGGFDLPRAVARCAREGEYAESAVQTEGSYLRVSLRPVPRFDDMRGGVLVVMEDLSAERRLEANQQRFLANAAHELKTPITTIVGAAELLLSEGDDLTDVQRRFLGHIASEAERMQRLSETLLALARTGWDFREPEMVAGELGMVEQAAERMRPLAEGQGIELLVQDRGYARVDPEWLEQALLILISNAIKFSERGGRVWVSAEGKTVTVRDEGSGIKEADLPHVFEPFYSGKAGPGGYGLGLPLCKELIERMGGSISIGGREGSGTIATIELLGV